MLLWSWCHGVLFLSRASSIRRLGWSGECFALIHLQLLLLPVLTTKWRHKSFRVSRQSRDILTSFSWTKAFCTTNFVVVCTWKEWSPLSKSFFIRTLNHSLIERFSFEHRLPCIGFLCDWPAKLRRLSQPMRSKTNRDLHARIFPPLALDTRSYFQFWLARCTVSVCCDWLE